jgi:hypothetical protein
MKSKKSNKSRARLVARYKSQYKKLRRLPRPNLIVVVAAVTLLVVGGSFGAYRLLNNKLALPNKHGLSSESRDSTKIAENTKNASTAEQPNQTAAPTPSGSTSSGGSNEPVSFTLTPSTITIYAFTYQATIYGKSSNSTPIEIRDGYNSGFGVSRNGLGGFTTDSVALLLGHSGTIAPGTYVITVQAADAKWRTGTANLTVILRPDFRIKNYESNIVITEGRNDGASYMLVEKSTGHPGVTYSLTSFNGPIDPGCDVDLYTQNLSGTNVNVILTFIISDYCEVGIYTASVAATDPYKSLPLSFTIDVR